MSIATIGLGAPHALRALTGCIFGPELDDLGCLPFARTRDHCGAPKRGAADKQENQSVCISGFHRLISRWIWFSESQVRRPLIGCHRPQSSTLIMIQRWILHDSISMNLGR